jgi:NitT/TauT family transport system substrate-binding protein
MKYIMDDPAKAAKTYAEAEPSFAGKEALLARILANYTERTYKGQKVLGEMDPKRLENLQKFYLEQGFIQKATPVGELYTNDFVQP